MKNKTKVIFMAAVIAIAVLFVTCNDDDKTDEQPKNQSAVLTNLFGEGYTATVKGTLTNTEWKGVAGKVENALNGAFNSGDGIDGIALKNSFRIVFEREGVTLIVEKDPQGYTKWKTSTDGKTIWLAFNALNTGLQSSLIDAVREMENSRAGFAQIKKQNRARFAAA